MPDRLLPIPPEFDPVTQSVVGTLTASLDDQLRRLALAVEDLSVEALEWQSAPGMNAIGMLLAHLALIEVWWIKLAPAGERTFSEMDPHFQELLGLRGADDGIPAEVHGFPDALRGRTAQDYLALLGRARTHVHGVLRTWRDADLARTVTGKRGTVSYRWILYHVLEHFAGHFGQVLLVRHQLGDAGLVGSGP